MNKHVFMLYVTFISIIHITYIAVFFGLLSTIPIGINYLTVFVQLFLCSLLLYRFNPFKKTYILSDFDHRFIFGCALLMFTNVVMVSLLKLPIVGNLLYQLFPWLKKIKKYDNTQTQQDISQTKNTDTTPCTCASSNTTINKLPMTQTSTNNESEMADQKTMDKINTQINDSIRYSMFS